MAVSVHLRNVRADTGHKCPSAGLPFSKIRQDREKWFPENCIANRRGIIVHFDSRQI